MKIQQNLMAAKRALIEAGYTILQECIHAIGGYLVVADPVHCIQGKSLRRIADRQVVVHSFSQALRFIDERS